MLESIGVIGAGSWGTTLADLLAKKGKAVTLWAYEKELVAEMASSRVNYPFLPDIELSPQLQFTNSLEEVVSGKALVLFVPPSQVLRGVLNSALPFLQDNAIITCASKG